MTSETAPCTCTTCNRCINREHHILTTIRQTINGVPDTFAHLIGIQAIDYNRDQIHQGTQPDKLPHGLDRTIDDWEQGINGIQTRTGLHETIQNWANAWAHQRGDTPTSTRTPITYLQDSLTWAATNPDTSGWDDYRHEIRATLSRIRHLTDTPDHQTAGANCLYCDTPLTNAWTRKGLSDRTLCPHCNREYTPASFTRAAQQMAQDSPTTKPDALITIEDAKQIFPNTRPNTLDVWAHKARHNDPTERATAPIEPKGKNRYGKTVYRLGDIAEAIETRTKVSA